MEKVLIGTFDAKTAQDKLRLEERAELAKRLKENGIPYQIVQSEWPRDCFVNFNGRVYTRKDHGFYADGGYILPNRDLTFACSAVSQGENGEIDSPELRFKKLKSLYRNAQVMPAPNPLLNRFISPHIDLVLLPLMERGVLFADQNYFDENKQDIDGLPNRHGLRMELLAQDYTNPTWPCNTLILRRGEEIIAVTNEHANSGLIPKLARLGVKVITTPFSHNCRVGGSVACATNTIPEGYREVKKILF